MNWWVSNSLPDDFYLSNNLSEAPERLRQPRFENFPEPRHNHVIKETKPPNKKHQQPTVLVRVSYCVGALFDVKIYLRCALPTHEN